MRHILTARAGLLALALAALPTGLLPGLSATPAEAQGTSVAAYVNDHAITRQQVAQRVRFMQVLNAPDANEQAATDALINERLQMDEARRLRITADSGAIQAGMAEFAARGGMDVSGFTAELAKSGVDAATFRDFITAGVLWRDVVRARVAPNITTTDRDVAQVRKKALLAPKVTSVLLSELIMPAPEGSEQAVDARAVELVRTIRSEAQFAAAARRYSAAATAENGGRLPWTEVASLPQGLAPILAELSPGQMTAPLSIPGAVVLFYLRDTRGTVRPGAHDETVEYLRLTVATPAEAAQVEAEATTCGMLYVAARGRPVVQQVQPASAVPADIAGVLARLDPDEAATINRAGATEIVMLCKREPTLLAGDIGEDPIPGLPGAPVANGADAVMPLEQADIASGFQPVPTDSEARDAVFNTKVTRGAETLMAELRANAIIRRN